MSKRSSTSLASPEANIMLGTMILFALAMMLHSGCGNGVVNWGEECDDGNNFPGDGCSKFCEREYCGDGIVNNGNEDCDDGNTEDGDGCSSSCIIEGSSCPSLQMIVQAGKDTSAASVTISTFNESIVVVAESRRWKTKEVCLHVGTDPVTLTAEGNANSTAFPYSTDFGGKQVSKFRGTFKLTELGVKCGDDVFVSLHMELIQMTTVNKVTKITNKETAWAMGSHPFPGQEGGSYSMYHVCC